MPDTFSAPDLFWQALFGILWPYVQQFLKNWDKFPLISKTTPLRNHIVSFLIALASSLEISHALTGSAATGWSLVITVPSLATLQHLAISWLTQHMTYQTLIKPGQYTREMKAMLQSLIISNAPPVIVDPTKIKEEDLAKYAQRSPIFTPQIQHGAVGGDPWEMELKQARGINSPPVQLQQKPQNTENSPGGV